MASSDPREGSRQSFFERRGVVITPDDLSWTDWPERAARAGLNTIALHPSPSVVSEFLATERGQRFLAQCRAFGLDVEYELHAMAELLPRSLFEKNPELFRMDEKGDRLPDANLCVSSSRALDIVAEEAVEIARILRPTTGRYFYWGDDGPPWCRCAQCRGLSDSDQALLMENRILAALKKADPRASLAHLAYHNTIAPPGRIAPQPGIFLEFAPIRRRHDVPMDADVDENRRDLGHLDANLAVFRRDTAQVLEYWIDASLFSDWKRPCVKIPWSKEVFCDDLDVYGGRGIRNATSFAVYVDAEYLRVHGEPPIDEYGRLLRQWPAGSRRVGLGPTEGAVEPRARAR